MKTKITLRTHQFRHPLLLWGATAFCLFLFGLFVSSAGARPRQDQTTQTHDHHKQPGVQDKATREETVKLSIPDLSLLDQQGRKISFYSDLVKGKTVAINFIFTTCTYWVTVERAAMAIACGPSRPIPVRSGPTAVPFPFSA